MSTSSRTTLGLTLFGVLAVLDISWIFQAWAGIVSGDDAPPVGVLVAFAVIGVATLAALPSAARGSRPAAWVAVGTGVLAALFADAPALFLGAPRWVMAVTTVAILLTIAGIWAMAPLLRRGSPAQATV